VRAAGREDCGVQEGQERQDDHCAGGLPAEQHGLLGLRAQAGLPLELGHHLRGAHTGADHEVGLLDKSRG